jgi:flagellar basal body P-ring formation protein FlgA
MHFRTPVAPRYRARIAAAALALLPFAALADSSAQMLGQVEDAARALLEEQAERDGLTDARISVTVKAPYRAPPPCVGQIEVVAQDVRSPQRMRFIATCKDSEGWSRKVQARAHIAADVVVAATDLPARQALGDSDVIVEQRDITGIPDYFADPADVIGMAGRRTLRSGEVLRKRYLAAAVLVHRGDPVRIVARKDGIEVQMGGEMLDSGGADDIVRVRNLSSGKVLRARVTGVGEVEPAGSGQ